MVKLQQRFDQEIVYRQPDRAASVGIAAKNSGLQFSRFVTNDLLLTANNERVMVIGARVTSNDVK
jgi:hypothetical protein